MKMPFPYALAAEFILFRDARKVTLPHLLVGIAFALGTAGTLVATKPLISLSFSVLCAFFVGLGMARSAFWLFRRVLPGIQIMVGWGFFNPPDEFLLDHKVRSYLGRAAR